MDLFGVSTWFNCFFLLVGPVVFIFAFVAYKRSGKIDEVLDRLRTLERQVEKLRADQNLARVEVVERPAAIATSGEPVEVLVADEIAFDPTYPRPKPAAALSMADIEAWIGGRGLGWAAVILLLFATAFFFRELFNRGLIGPLGRVAIGIAFGFAACWVGYRQHKKGWAKTCQMMTAAGIVLIYLSVFASFGFYDLVSRDNAGIFLVLVVIEAFALAVLYEAPGVAIMAIIGGLLNPILLRSDQDRYVSLFFYLAVLNAGVVGLLLIRRWRAVSLIMILGTQFLFWLWFDENYHPHKLSACLAFQLGIAGLWSVYQLAGPLTRFVSANWEDLIRSYLVASFLAVAGYVLLDDRYHEWMGTFALGLAIVHTGLTWLVLRRRPADARHAMAEWVLAMGFLAVVMPLQAQTAWVAVCWAVQGLALWAFGLRLKSLGFSSFGLFFMALAGFRFLIMQTAGGVAHPAPFTPLFNSFALPGCAIVACMVVASILGRRARPTIESPLFMLSRVVGLSGLALLWIILSLEAFDSFNSRRFASFGEIQAELPVAQREMDRQERDIMMRNRDHHLARAAQVALSITWGLYAIALLTIGLKLPSRPLRWSALILFGITLAKVFTVDMENLGGLYRVAAFFALSVLLGAAAWGYQKVKLSWLAVEEDDRHATPI